MPDPEAPHSAFPVPRSKVLVVDDERSIRTTLAEFIREEGHDVFTAADAAQALQLLVEHEPAVIVTDIILPGMTGVDLLERINKIAPDVQVVMITGEPTVETAAEAVRLGAFDYLSKPIMRPDFIATVTSALRVEELAQQHRRLERENEQHRERLEQEVEKRTAALRASEEKYRAFVENAAEAVFIAQHGVMPFANSSTSKLSGRSLEELSTTPYIEWVHPDDRDLIADRYQQWLKREDLAPTCEFRILRPDGEARWCELHSVPFNWEGKPALLNFASDVTVRKQRESREAARWERTRQMDATLLQLAMGSDRYQESMLMAIQAITKTSAHTLQVERVSIWLYTETGDAIECLDLYELSTDKHTSGAVLKKDIFPAYFRVMEQQRTIVAHDAHQDPRTAEFSEIYLTPLGITAMLDVPIRLEGEPVGVVCYEHVGTQREWEQEDVNFAGSIANLVALTLAAENKRLAEIEREQSEIRYKNLFDGSPVSLWQEDFSQSKALLERIQASGIQDMEEYLLNHPEVIDECIRLIEIMDANQAAIALHAAESKEELLGNLSRIIPLQSRNRFIPQLIAILNGEPSFETTSIDQRFDGSEVHVAIRWIAVPGYEESLASVLVSKIDITATVEAEKSLQQALDGAIVAIGMTTEIRDPYTAGHQRRVTELAVAIACQMGLELGAIEGTRTAGLMHDIGKLAIPAEILSKPSALNVMERLLIETHPQAAYDILQTISFPWPIAQIVLQHHERIDGTGYPQGLTNDDILIEARILAVADTVEAMASHRPYRPALGVELALEEIDQHRGTKYDSDVVDACLYLFRERKFAFTD